jgi:hypothetical protein
MGKSTINGHFQYYVNLPEGNPNPCGDFADFGVRWRRVRQHGRRPAHDAEDPGGGVFVTPMNQGVWRIWMLSIYESLGFSH